METVSFKNGTRQMYEVRMPDGTKIRFWFIGKQLQNVLDAYNVPYKLVKERK